MEMTIVEKTVVLFIGVVILALSVSGGAIFSRIKSAFRSLTRIDSSKVVDQRQTGKEAHRA